MSWAYNEIDIYLTELEQTLGETSVEGWTAVSSLGIVRSRVALTPSSYEADTIKIAGRDGRPYSTDRSRQNAKIDIEVLVADTWVFANATSTVRQRADALLAKINYAKRLSYKQPGKAADGYFLIYNATTTITDADEKAIVIKASFEVHPLEWLFAGNSPLILTASESRDIEIPDYCDISRPVYVFPGAGTLRVGSKVLTSYVESSTVRLDTWRFLATTTPSGLNVNKYLIGDYEDLWLPRGATTTVTNGFSSAMRIYTRIGIVR